MFVLDRVFRSCYSQLAENVCHLFAVFKYSQYLFNLSEANEKKICRGPIIGRYFCYLCNKHSRIMYLGTFNRKLKRPSWFISISRTVFQEKICN